MADRSNYQQVGIDLDQESFNQLQRATEGAAQGLIQIGGAAAKTSVSVQQLDAVTQLLSRQNAIQEVAKQYASLGKTINDDVEALRQMRVALKEVGATGQEISSATHAFSGFKEQADESGPGQIRGVRRGAAALQRVGLGEVAQPLALFGDVQEISKLFEQFGAKLQTVVPALSAVDAGFLGLSTVLAPLAILVGGIALGVKLYNDSLEESSKALDKARIAVDTYYKAVQDGTTETVQRQIDTLKSQKGAVDAELKTIQAALDSGFKAAQQTFGGDVGARIATAGMAATNEEFRKLGDRANELKKQSSDLDGQLQGLGTAMGSAAVKANDLAETTLKLADQNAQTQIDSYKLIREGTVKQVQEIIDTNRDKLQAYTAELTTLQAVKNPNADIQKRIQELYAELNKLSLSSANLTQNVLPLVESREQEADALKELNKQLQETEKLREARAQKEVDIVKKYDEAVQTAEDTATQSRISANQKLQDALVNAAQKAVDDVNKALDQLEQKRASNLLSLTRDQEKLDREAGDQSLNDQIKQHRQERDDLQQHLDNLKQIRDRDASRERDDQLNRNYRDLFALKEQKSQDMTSENDRFTGQKQQRQQALQDEQNDQARAIQVQRRERLISYQQANEDALQQYNAEIETARAAKVKAIELAQQSNQRELTLIRTGLVNKETLLRQGAVNELQLVTQTEAAKQQIFQGYLDRANEMLGQSSTPEFTGQTRPQYFAEGGNVRAGQRAIVNDGREGRQRESFQGVQLPRGLGLFIPAQAGYVNPGTSGAGDKPISVSIPISINGVNNPVELGRIIDNHLEVKVPSVVKRMLI